MAAAAHEIAEVGVAGAAVGVGGVEEEAVGEFELEDDGGDE